MSNYSAATECVPVKLTKALLEVLNTPQIAPQDQLLAVLDLALADKTCPAGCAPDSDASRKCTEILLAMRAKITPRTAAAA